jgi:hypothetical protein
MPEAYTDLYSGGVGSSQETLKLLQVRYQRSPACLIYLLLHHAQGCKNSD